MRETFVHFRVDESGKVKPRRRKDNWRPAERGGGTLCMLWDGDKLVATGFSECSPKDVFCFNIGRIVARARALSALTGKRVTFSIPRRGQFSRDVYTLVSKKFDGDGRAFVNTILESFK